MFHRSVHLPSVLLFFHGLTFVELFLTACKGYVEFRQSVLIDKESDGNVGETGRFGILFQVPQLLLVEE